jgi:molecular chaperone DnaK (HSP70)
MEQFRLPSVQQKILSFVERREKERKMVDGISVVMYLGLRADIVYDNLQVLIDQKKLIKVVHLTGSSLKLVKHL